MLAYSKKTLLLEDFRLERHNSVPSYYLYSGTTRILCRNPILLSLCLFDILPIFAYLSVGFVIEQVSNFVNKCNMYNQRTMYVELG